MVMPDPKSKSSEGINPSIISAKLNIGIKYAKLTN